MRLHEHDISGINSLELGQKSLYEETIGLSNSTTGIREVLEEIKTTQASSRQLDVANAERMDRLMVMMQQSLIASLSTKSPTLGKQKRREPNGKTRTRHRQQSRIQTKNLPSTASHQSSLPLKTSGQLTTNPNKIVDVVVVARYRQGKASVRAVAVPDPNFEEADRGTKIQMIQSLQSLQLLLWLMRENFRPEHWQRMFYHSVASSLTDLSYTPSEVTTVLYVEQDNPWHDNLWGDEYYQKIQSLHSNTRIVPLKALPSITLDREAILCLRQGKRSAVWYRNRLPHWFGREDGLWYNSRLDVAVKLSDCRYIQYRARRVIKTGYVSSVELWMLRSYLHDDGHVSLG